MADTARRGRSLPPTDASKAAGVPLATGVVATEPEPVTPVTPEPPPGAPQSAPEAAASPPAAPEAAQAVSGPQEAVQPRLQPAALGVQWTVQLPAPATDMDPDTQARWEHWLNATAGKFAKALQAAQKAQTAWGNAVADARAAGVDENVIVGAALRVRVPVPSPDQE